MDTKWGQTLVFGGTGFIGGHVARSIRDAGGGVTVFKRASSKAIGLEAIDFATGDLDDRASIRKAAAGFKRHVFCAAYYPLVSARPAVQVGRALAQVRNFFAGLDPDSDVVFVSSYSTVGAPRAGRLADETTPYDPARNRSTYYKIKFEMEQEALRQAAARPGRTVIVIPTGVFGDYDVKPTSSRVVLDAALGRLPFKISGPVNAVDVHDATRGILAALERGRSGERYILGGENTTIEALLETVCRVVGRPVPKIPMPFSVMRAAATISESLHRAFGRQGFPLIPVTGVDLMENAMHVSSARAERELGYTHGPVRPALVRAYEWFRANNYL